MPAKISVDDSIYLIPSHILLNSLIGSFKQKIDPGLKYIISLSSKIGTSEYRKRVDPKTIEYLTDLGLRESNEPSIYLIQCLSHLRNETIAYFLDQLQYRDSLVTTIARSFGVDITNKPKFDWISFLIYNKSNPKYLCELMHYTGNILGSLPDVCGMVSGLENWPEIFEEKGVHGYLLNIYTGVIYSYQNNKKCIQYFMNASKIETSIVYSDWRFDSFFAIFRILVARIKKLNSSKLEIKKNITFLNEFIRDFGNNDRLFLSCVITNIECLWLLKQGEMDLVSQKLENAKTLLKKIKLSSLSMNYSPAFNYKIQILLNIAYFHLINGEKILSLKILHKLKRMTLLNKEEEVYYNILLNLAYIKISNNQNRIAIRYLFIAESYFVERTQTKTLQLIYKLLFVAFSSLSKNKEMLFYFEKYQQFFKFTNDAEDVKSDSEINYFSKTW